MADALSKKQLDALGQVFNAEIECHPPFQSRAKIYRDLRDAGLLEDVERRFGPSWFLSVTVKGFVLTHAGRIAFCESCRDAPDA